MYEMYEKLRAERGVLTKDVCEATGISQNVMSNWKKRGGNLNLENSKKLADYFGVPVSYFVTGELTPIASERRPITNVFKEDFYKRQEYYSDPKVSAIMHKLATSPGRRALFDAVADMNEETVQKYADFIKGVTDDNKNN